METDTTIQPTFSEEDIKESKKCIQNNIRIERNKLLNDSDKYLLPDFPISAENKNLIIEYRQKLRDYMELEVIKELNGEPLPPFPQFPI